MRTCITRNTSDIQIQHAGFLHVDCVTVAVLYSIHKGRIKFECRSQIATFPNRLGIHPAESMLGPQTLSRPVWRGPMLQCLTGWTEHNKNGPQGSKTPSALPLLHGTSLGPWRFVHVHLCYMLASLARTQCQDLLLLLLRSPEPTKGKSKVKTRPCQKAAQTVECLEVPLFPTIQIVDWWLSISAPQLDRHEGPILSTWLPVILLKI